MGKPPPSVGTTAQELRDATRDANAARKDLESAIRDARAALHEARTYADKISAEFRGVVAPAMDRMFKESLDSHRDQLRAELNTVAAAAIAEVDRRLAAEIARLSAKVQRTLNDPEAFANALKTTRDDFLANVGHAPTEKEKEILASFEALVTDAAAKKGKPEADEVDDEAFQMTIYDTRIAVCRPVSTKGISPAAVAAMPDLAPGQARRNCGACKQAVWVLPVQFDAFNRQQVQLLCYPCASGIIGITTNAADATVIRHPNGHSTITGTLQGLKK